VSECERKIEANQNAKCKMQKSNKKEKQVERKNYIVIRVKSQPRITI
jgi:hypothetical protein